jgi:hypothetical protein
MNTSLKVVDLDSSTYDPNQTILNTEVENPDNIIQEESKEDEEQSEEHIRQLNLETQQILLKTFEGSLILSVLSTHIMLFFKLIANTFEYLEFYKQESETMLSILGSSRNQIKDSVLELINEQVRHKEELTKVTEGKYTYNRKKENSTPLSVYMRRKRGNTPGSSSSFSINSMNSGLSSQMSNISNS